MNFQVANEETVEATDVRGLVCFLYVLLRDYLPAGEVEKIFAEHVVPSLDAEALFSNPHLHAYAGEIAARLVKRHGLPMTVCVEKTEGEESMSGVRLADLKEPEEEVTHHLKHGQTPCPMSKEHGAPMVWPRGHVWSQLWKDVTCEECLKKKTADEARGEQ